MQRIHPYHTTSKALHVQFRRAVTKRMYFCREMPQGHLRASQYSYEILCEPVLFQFAKGTVLPMLYDLTRLGAYFRFWYDHSGNSLFSSKKNA
jgi:hypothetical protein